MEQGGSAEGEPVEIKSPHQVKSRRLLPRLQTRTFRLTTALELQREGLSVAEACAVAGIGRTKFYEAIANGSLRARKFGKRTIILRSDLQEFLSELPVAN